MSHSNAARTGCGHDHHHHERRGPVRNVEAVRRLASLTKGLSLAERANVVSALRELADRGTLNENTRGSASAVAKVRQGFEREWFNALQRFDKVKAKVAASRASAAAKARQLDAARAALEAEWTAALRRGYEDSFRLGHAARGGTGSAGLTTMQIGQISPQVEATVQRQAQFSGQFARQYAAGELNAKGRMGVGPRSQLCAKSLHSGFNMGAVSMGKPGEKIYWRLGACDHCADCPAIANSGPYTRDTLPCYPGDGSTACASNCCCFLVFKKGPKPIDQPEPDGQPDRIADPRRSAPPGMKPPSDQQMAHLQDLEARRNYARRKIGSLPDGPERDKWLKTRSALQGQINDFKAANRLHKPPTFSTGEVITGRDLSVKDVNSIFARGIDGTTIRAADARSVSDLAARADAELTDALRAAGLSGPSVRVPNPVLDIRTTSSADGAIPQLRDLAKAREAAETETKLHEADVKDAYPSVTNVWTICIAGNGMIANIRIHMAVLKIMARRLRFARIGPLDQTWPMVVGAMGSWVRGNAEDVEAIIEELKDEEGAPPFVVAPYVTP